MPFTLQQDCPECDSSEESGKFLCAKTKRCIDRIYVCDGEVNCATEVCVDGEPNCPRQRIDDNSDELNCNLSKYFICLREKLKLTPSVARCSRYLSIPSSIVFL